MKVEGSGHAVVFKPIIIYGTSKYVIECERTETPSQIILARSMQFILLYASPAWTEAIVNSQRKDQVNLIY